MTTDAIRPRFPWGLTVLAVIAVAILLALGTWQVQRLQWKAGLIAQSEASATLPPVSLDDLGRLAQPEFRSAILPCDVQNRPFVELQSIHDGQPVIRIITACDGWLVDLGHVAADDALRPQPLPAAIPGITVQARRVERPNGFAPPPQGRRFFARDSEAMARMLGMTGPVRPYVLFATASAWPEWTALSASPPPAAFSNNHLGYALTWYGLALVLVVFYGVLLRRRMRQP